MKLLPILVPLSRILGLLCLALGSSLLALHQLLKQLQGLLCLALGQLKKMPWQ